jgi:xanthine/CO dehydrogenase XdhC/CoxF family maturation factor
LAKFLSALLFSRKATAHPVTESNMPESPKLSDPLAIAEAWQKGGRDVAIATVVETWGSAPRGVGSNLVIDSAGNFEGSVSGGCVEGSVIEEALDVIRSGQPRLLEFGIADETAWKVGLTCGGRIKVYVEKLA